MVVALMLCGIVLAGCGKEDDMELQERAEARAAKARGFVDDLAARVGTAPEVVQDEMGDCVPGREDSGIDLSYTVRVAVDDGAADRLRGEISDHFAAEGWEVKVDPVDPENQVVSVRFAKDTFTMGAKISESDGRASVGGSGGCVK
ncbi:hypothetical protein AFL01nite_28090 [Aeromicrobium flavum]|uniref:Lipoprotein n=1 Tax=Aeromicrobium flavum TaxID=416568 RepID=A0A512HYG5_9ACTN|nr:hypothetical protein [Aeromicrobium flavum]GEO90482.1 hypothetical protein AFL01nite_28090 [Aeromicrobium flavum]